MSEDPNAPKLEQGASGPQQLAPPPQPQELARAQALAAQQQQQQQQQQMQQEQQLLLQQQMQQQQQLQQQMQQQQYAAQQGAQAQFAQQHQVQQQQHAVQMQYAQQMHAAQMQAAQMQAAPPPADAGGGWAERRDPNSGRFFFHNSLTGESSWTRPAELGAATGQPGAQQMQAQLQQQQQCCFYPGQPGPTAALTAAGARALMCGAQPISMVASHAANGGVGLEGGYVSAQMGLQPGQGCFMGGGGMQCAQLQLHGGGGCTLAAAQAMLQTCPSSLWSPPSRALPSKRSAPSPLALGGSGPFPHAILKCARLGLVCTLTCRARRWCQLQAARGERIMS
ncbi:hypothetical protein T492DRAFT_256443 [Pavlovales sp. CCMP2436]|nr:hypothetical protein T492DRAFT_256443 [Pavlovales sp. CCMP2436]